MERELDVLTSVIREAGRRAMEIAARGWDVYTKPDHSPVTSADLEVNRILQEGLREAFPEDGWLSEETADAPARLQAKRVWIVDPIDGTKYFIERIPEFVISVALVEAGEPQLGVALNPATGELFAARRGRGATLDGERLHVATAPRERFVLFGAPPAMRRGKLDPLKPFVELKPMGSIAYSLAQIAAGRADGTVNIARMNEWDIAAGVLLVQESGGFVTDSHGSIFRFNKPDTTVHGIVAGRPDIAPHTETWAAALRARVKR